MNVGFSGNSTEVLSIGFSQCAWKSVSLLTGKEMIFPPFVRSFWEASLIISQNPFTLEDSRSSRKDRVTRLINSCIEDNFVSIKYPGT